MTNVTLDIAIRTVNIASLIGGIWVVLKVVVPVFLAVRDSLRDSAVALHDVKKILDDHEARLRYIEKWDGKERRKR